MVTWLVGYRLSERKELVHSALDKCKGGRQELVLSGNIIYHRDRDGAKRLVSWDIRGWWVARAISEKATWITTWQIGLVLWWFDSQVYGSFLFHLVAWWFWTTRVGYVMTWDSGLGHRKFWFCDMRLILTMEKIWFYNKKGDGTLEISRLPKWQFNNS